MKRYFVILWVFLIFLSGCTAYRADSEAGNNVRPNDSGMALEGYSVNNEPLTDQDTAYPIEDLRRCFQDAESDLLYLDDIHTEFSLTHLRKLLDRDSYYIAYPVIEGGKYLVFLNTVLDPDSGEEKVAYWGSIYVFDLPEEEAFANLNAGDSFADVQALGTYTFMPVMSSGFISYSLLCDGNVMQCSYTRADDHSLILADRKLLTAEDPDYPYAGMVPSDLVE